MMRIGYTGITILRIGIRLRNIDIRLSHTRLLNHVAVTIRHLFLQGSLLFAIGSLTASRERKTECLGRKFSLAGAVRGDGMIFVRFFTIVGDFDVEVIVDRTLHITNLLTNEYLILHGDVAAV